LRIDWKRVVSSTGAAVVVAFLIRVVCIYYDFRVFEQPAVRDNLHFGAETGWVAAAIASGRGFSSPLNLVRTGATAWFAPVYPYLLAGIFKLFGIFSYKSNVVIHFIDVAFAAFTCWPIETIGTRIFGKKTGLAAAWVWVLLPSAIFFPVVWVWDTALAGLWMALLVAATLKLRGSDRLAPWLGYGVLWAIGSMINPSLVAVLPFLALWAIWPIRQQFVHAAKLAAASAILFAVCIAPWTIRNYVAFHRFIPFRSNFGLEFWLGNNPDVSDSCSCSIHPNSDPVEAAKYARMTEIPYMEEKQTEAMAFVRAHPLDALRFAFRRFEDNWLGMWDSPVDVWATAPLYVKLIVVYNISFSLLAFLGTWLAFRARQDSAPVFGSVMLAFPFVFYITHPSARYRFPMDPIMLVVAVYAIAYSWSGLAAWRGANAVRSVAPVDATL
jgi:4-amino-4-deoxy-L-arabinose transferase-like glycosyltransferase